ncbi:SipW-dependent-type signal peptide-containing protein [Demequina aurantiaca]|uniref:SipW-dependent-type signal peptide-containing protein n=1 Tax=Demequina aurantiaca TaxID=676200 RepID=UPI003D32B3F5
MEQAKRNKVMAILAGGAILGVGGAFTLAAWTDTEWVFAGDGTGGPGVSTSVFEVEQNTSFPFDGLDTSFSNQEDNPGGTLGFDALAMTPSQVVYAPVALRSTADSLAGTLHLNAAVDAAIADDLVALDPNNYLWDNLELAVGYEVLLDGVNPPACDEDEFDDFTGQFSGSGLSSGPAAANTQALLAAGANVAHYCFRITMPTTLTGPTPSINDLQGLSVAPAWLFDATSTEP